MIEVSALTKSLGGKPVLSSIDLAVQDNGILGLVGHNGAGKTTLMRAMMGIYRPDSGEVRVDGEPIWENEVKKRALFFMGEEQFLLPGASMETMASFYRGFFPRFSMEVFRKLVGLFGLNPKERMRKFSKGMRRQAGLIMAFASHAQYLLLDEVFDGLDPVMRDLVRKLLKEGIAAAAVTVMISSHNLMELENLCDHIALLRGHRVAYQGTLEDLCAGSCHVRAIFAQDVTPALLAGLPLTFVQVQKRVVSARYEGTREKAEEAFAALSPIHLETRPLTLEEVYLKEMEVQGYDLEGIFG